MDFIALTTADIASFAASGEAEVFGTMSSSPSFFVSKDFHVAAFLQPCFFSLKIHQIRCAPVFESHVFQSSHPRYCIGSIPSPQKGFSLSKLITTGQVAWSRSTRSSETVLLNNVANPIWKSSSLAATENSPAHSNLSLTYTWHCFRWRHDAYHRAFMWCTEGHCPVHFFCYWHSGLLRSEQTEGH